MIESLDFILILMESPCQILNGLLSFNLIIILECYCLEAWIIYWGEEKPGKIDRSLISLAVLYNGDPSN